MGACASNDAGGAGGAAAAVDGVTVVMTPFEAKLAAHVKQVCEEEKARVEAEADDGEEEEKKEIDMSQHLTKILLRLPTVKKSFERLRALYTEVDTNGDHSISMEELSSATAFAETNADDLKIFFTEADIDHSNGIEFKEFILVMAFAYFGGEGALPKLDAEVAEQTRLAFLIAAQAFHFFDTDHDGSIVKSEVIGSLMRTKSVATMKAGGSAKSSGGGKGGGNLAFMQSRFAEMDANADGCITFKEFLFAFVDWAGIEDEESEVFGAEEE